MQRVTQPLDAGIMGDACPGPSGNKVRPVRVFRNTLWFLALVRDLLQYERKRISTAVDQSSILSLNKGYSNLPGKARRE